MKGTSFDTGLVCMRAAKIEELFIAAFWSDSADSISSCSASRPILALEHLGVRDDIVSRREWVYCENWETGGRAMV